MKPAYELSSAAESDLRGIIRCTRARWGDAQTRKYVAGLTRGIEALAAGQGAFRAVDALHPGLRVARVDHHYVFCLPRADGPALIVAILHERMDLMVRLAGRLAP